MVKCPECGIDNSFYDEERGEVICHDCGLVIEESTIDFTGEPRHKIKDNDDTESGSSLNQFFPYKKYKRYNSDYKKDKKELGFKISPMVMENLSYIKELEDLIKELLPDKVKKEVFGQLNDFVKLNYPANSSSLPKTRNKMAVIRGILISKIDNEMKKPQSPEDLVKCSSALKKLQEVNPMIYQSAERIFSKSLETQAKKMNDILPDFATVAIDMDKIDPTWKENQKQGFHNLFSKEQYPQSPLTIAHWENEVFDAGAKLAEFYLKNEINIQVLNGVKNPELRKGEGLICACCYFVCKDNGFKPLSQDEWAKFFCISSSIIDKRIKELKEFLNHPISTIPLGPTETRIEKEELILKKA